ncbi:MAG: hypothetical protein LYZ69_03400 [Nitrososphaerales archaeon]|nr:hypothetical protein [Nitrososphaerales archaeon]
MKGTTEAPTVIVIDCSELTANEKLVLASKISERLAGSALALSRGDDLVVDQLNDGELEPDAVLSIVKEFISKAEGPGYSLEQVKGRIVVHSPKPADRRSKRKNQLPPNLKQCPFCPFITPYDEAYTVHLRAHLFGA